MFIGRADLIPRGGRREGGGVNNPKIGANSRPPDDLSTKRERRDRSRPKDFPFRPALSPLASLSCRRKSHTVNFAHAYPDRKIETISRIATDCVHYRPFTSFLPPCAIPRGTNRPSDFERGLLSARCCRRQ